MTCSSPITAHLTPRPRHHEPRHAQVVAGAHDGAEVSGVAHAAEDDPDRARGGGGGGVRGERLVPQRRHVRHDALVHVVLLVPAIIIIINRFRKMCCPHLSAWRHKLSSPGLLSSTHLTPRLSPSCASSAARPLPGL